MGKMLFKEKWNRLFDDLGYKLLKFFLQKITSFPKLFFIAFIASYFSSAPLMPDDSPTKEEFFKPVIRMLLDKGADSVFVMKLINHPNTSFNEKYTSVYVPLADKPEKIVPAYHSKYAKTYDIKAVEKARVFVIEHYSKLQKAQSLYNVPMEVIASVLWIETRHGSFLGDNHIGSVYLSLAMAGQEQFYEMNKKALLKRIRGRSNSDRKKYLNKLKSRTELKVNWALDQLFALQEMDNISPVPIYEIYGSYAGAFGISQFIPSSYMSWAVDGNKDMLVNLFDPADAIFSVANYLNTNGWNNDDEYSQLEAVFHYNNSSSYVYAVLKLAENLKAEINKIEPKGINQQ